MTNFVMLVQDFGLSVALAVVCAICIHWQGRRSRLVRAAIAGLCVLLLLRYALWRIGVTFPRGQPLWAEVWAALFLVLEGLILLRLMLTHGLMARTRDRGPEADAWANSRGLTAPVDVFITTSGEADDIIERAIIGACAIHHPDLRVWLLDTARREGARALATAHGIHYLPREPVADTWTMHVNAALATAIATARRPEFMLLLDARFVPGRDFLRRTLPLFEDPGVGIVQTPQHVFTPDPTQVNILSPLAWPDEQHFFFDVLLPALDAWDGAICCGTSAVFRVAALEDAGGMATGTLTDDMMTSLKLVARGWRTVYLNEPLSLGLAPEGLDAYVTQRGRWCRGAIQQLATSLSFMGRGRLRPIDRISNLTAVLTWTSGFPFRLMMLTAPLVWCVSGASVIDASIHGLARELAPALTMTTLFMVVYGGRRFLPFLSDATRLVDGLIVLRAMRARMPPRRPRHETDEPRITVLREVWPLAVLLMATVVAVSSGLIFPVPWFSGPDASLYCAWSLFNIVLLLLSCAACVNLPRHRRDQRFPSGEHGVVLAPSMAETLCTVVDISVGGACLFVTQGWRAPPREGVLRLDGGALRVPFVLLSAEGETIRVRFTPSRDVRHALILKLFDPRYAGATEQPTLAHALVEAVLGDIG